MNGKEESELEVTYFRLWKCVCTQSFFVCWRNCIHVCIYVWGTLMMVGILTWAWEQKKNLTVCPDYRCAHCPSSTPLEPVQVFTCTTRRCAPAFKLLTHVYFWCLVNHWNFLFIGYSKRKKVLGNTGTQPTSLLAKCVLWQLITYSG